MRTQPALLRPIAPLLFALIAFAPAHASVGDWGEYGLEVTRTWERLAAIAPDGAGGAFVVTDIQCCGSNDSLELHHVLAGGVLDPAWPEGGLLLSSTPGLGGGIQAFADGIGGLFILWSQGGSSPSWDQRPRKLIHVESDGSVSTGWPAGGIVLPILPANYESVFDADADGVGGVIVSWVGTAVPWTDSINVFAQRYTRNAQRLWPTVPGEEGFRVCTANRIQYGVRCARDGTGGAWIAWNDQRHYSYFQGQEIYLSRVRSVGKATLGTNGMLAVPDAQFVDLDDLAAVDTTGVNLVFVDGYDFYQPRDTYLQRIDDSGAPQWGLWGLPLGATPRWDVEGALTPHLDGQVSLTWIEQNVGQHWGRYSSDGSLMWEDPFGSSPPVGPMLATDVDDGELALWSAGNALMGSRLTSAGTPRPGWSATGDVLDTTGVYPAPRDLAFDPATGQAFAVWTTELSTDTSQPPNWAVRVQRFSPAPVGVTPGAAPDGFSIVALSPNPSTASFTLRFRLPRAQSVRIEAFDIAGRRVAVQESSTLPAGEHALELRLPATAAPGVYRVRLSAGGRSVTRTAIRLR